MKLSSALRPFRLLCSAIGPFRRRVLGLAALAVLWGIPVWPQVAEAAEIRLFRTVFHDRTDRPERKLAPAIEVEIRDEVWLVEGASSLHIQSDDPQVVAVLRFKPHPQNKGEFTLDLVLLSRPGLFGFHYQHDSQLLKNGNLMKASSYRVETGIDTELTGVDGAVTSIVLDDDAMGELRLKQQGGRLVLRIISPVEGGKPSGGKIPFYHGESLRFLDYGVLVSLWEDNALIDLHPLEHLGIGVNYFSDGDNSVTLTRAVARIQLSRWRYFSVWLEGGGAQYQQSTRDEGDVNDGSPTWVFGATGHLRSGDWGTAAHFSTVNGANLIMLMGGWQISRGFGALLHWQSFLSYSGYGLGFSWDF